ncbi:hypothetical protein AAD35_004743 [Salmonella enterica subsp. enterica]|nr:hypothetical protein [Salmonella enterica subsp. enterica]
MKVSVRVLKDFDCEIIPFKFRANWDDGGRCYLRIQIRGGKFVFTTAQLFDYNNTSITNAAENIQESVINYMVDNGIVAVDMDRQILDLLRSSERIQREVDTAVLTFFNQNSLWLQYYPAELSISDKAYMMRTMFPVEEDHYMFRGFSQEREIAESEGFDFTIDDKKLRNWQQN